MNIFAIIRLWYKRQSTSIIQLMDWNINWAGCPVVVDRNGPVLRDDRHVHPDLVVEDLRRGFSPHEVAMIRRLKTHPSDINVAYGFASEQFTDRVRRYQRVHVVLDAGNE